MAGSLKYFVYTADDGVEFAVLADESNTEAVNAGTQDYPNAGLSGIPGKYKLPRNLYPRHAVYTRDILGGKRTVRVICLTETIFDGLPAALPTLSIAIGGGPAEEYVLSAMRVETIKPRPIGIDTGLTDGDAT